MSKPIILTVDDDPDTLSILDAVLGAEYETVHAATGHECLGAVKGGLPDLIVLDYDLPDIQGSEVCRILRRDPLFLGTPILMLTGKGEIEDKVAGLDAGVDDYVVKPFDPEELSARVRMLMRRSSANLDANPLTRIPGNISISSQLEERIGEKKGFAVLYIDIDNFKAVNDYYGFERGDRVIKESARILIRCTQEKGSDGDFIGHIGGDDFVIVTVPEHAEGIAEDIIAEFDRTAPGFFDEEDRAKGYVEVKARDGLMRRFGLPTISIGIVSTENRSFSHVAEIGSLGAELKQAAKTYDGSNFVIDRRGI
jgi:diguanylate cyclase (GGDEF)-like protein